jgi:rubrerythrin
MKRLIALGSFFLVLLIAASATPTARGAKAAALDSDRSVSEMLNYAIEDEYLARAEYDSIMKKFGNMRPFSNIIKAEENHIAWLRDAFADAKLALPKDEAASLVKAPDTIKEAFMAGVQAEIDNIAMYDSFLASPLMARSENASIKALFIRLRDASKNHLEAFQNGLAKY